MCSLPPSFISSISWVHLEFISLFLNHIFIKVLVTSHQGYWRCLLTHLPDLSLVPLKTSLHTAAQRIVPKSKYDPVTPLLKIIGWHLITFIVKFIVLSLAFTALPGRAFPWLPPSLPQLSLCSCHPELHAALQSHQDLPSNLLFPLPGTHLSPFFSSVTSSVLWDVSQFLLEAFSMPRLIYIPNYSPGWTGIFFYLSVSAIGLLQDRDCFQLCPYSGQCLDIVCSQ